ncbi:hypothetical protein OHR86_22460 [Streptomyces sp. NBC_00441]|uniref:hypothetical protein n=1 Tax=Streptomyces sp. NBC_00441 TaxID=2975742 RepID=UPI002E2809EC|nr:hypothetical protein [Streptomyces sp. NBC_00441]
MSREPEPETDEEPEPEEPAEASSMAGGCVLTALAGAGLGGAYAASPALAVGAVWVAGMTAMWRVARSVPHAANPAPPPVSEGADDTKPQFTIVEDREGHCVVQWARGATKP